MRILPFSKRAQKFYKMNHCYLLAQVTKEGLLVNVSTFSERNPTFLKGDRVLLLMTTRGTSYQKAVDAMHHCVRINKRYKWVLEWIDCSFEAHMKKPDLWRKADNGEIHVKHCNLESKFLASLSAT